MSRQQGGVVGCLTLLVILTAGSAADAAPKLGPKLARIASPAPDGLGRDGRIRVVVRLAPDVKRFRVNAGGRDVTRRFARRRGGRTRVAVLRRDQGVLRYGTNYLYVTVRGTRGRRAVESVRFVLARRAEPFLRVPARRTSAGRIRVPVRVGGSTAVVRATVNGHRARPFPERGRSRSVVLAGDDRLHHGRNRVRLVAFDRQRGVYDIARSTLVMRRSRPIPAAGPPRRIAGMRMLRLDGRFSRAARGGHLSYRWRIVRRPRGSKARLRGATRRRPRLRPDVRGTYHVKLTVRERARSRRASASAVASASDSIPLFIAPSDPSGVTLATRTTSSSRGVLLNGSRLVPADSSAALQLVVLSRATTELLANESYTGDSAGTAALLKRVQGLDATQLVVITTPNADSDPSPLADQTSLANVNAVMSRVGGEGVWGGCGASGCGVGFSIVGIPGLAQKTADYSLGLARVPAGSAGEMKGYLQEDSTGSNFAYVSADHVSFDAVGDETSPLRAAITVGDCAAPPALPPDVPLPVRVPCTSYDSQLLATGSSGGFFVLVLDAGTLEQRDAGTFDIGAGGEGAISGALQAMHTLIQRYENDPTALVFIQSIGHVGRTDGVNSPTANAWNLVAGDQGDLGGQAYLFQALAPGAGGSYALVAPGQKQQPCKYECVTPDVSVASPAATGTPGRLAGVLSRNGRGQYRAEQAAPLTDPPESIAETVYQDAVPWPMRDPEHAAALRCVTAAMQDRAGAGVVAPIEANYWNDGLIGPGDLSDLKTALAGLEFGRLDDVAECTPATFTSTEFTDVTQQLTRELGYVGLVTDFITDMQTPFIVDQNGATGELQRAISTVYAAVAPPPQAPASVDGLAIAGDLLDAIGVIPVPGIEAGAGAAAALFQLLDDTQKGPAGAPDVDLTAPANGLAFELSTQVLTSVNRYDRIGGILVGDWGRLARTATNAAPGQPWAFGTTEKLRAEDGIQTAAARLGYRGLFGLRYWAYILNGAHQPPGLNSPADYRCATWGQDPNTFKPFRGGYVTPFEGYAAPGGFSVVSAAGPPFDAWWVFGNVDSDFISANNGIDASGKLPTPTGGRTPPASLMTAMLTTPGPDGINPIFPSKLRFALDEFFSVGMRYVNTTSVSWGRYELDGQCVVDDTAADG